MKTQLILKNGFHFRGKIVEETTYDLVINDRKLGRTVVSKDIIAVRSDSND
ncbi:MAG: hypothetical protein WCW13_03505 [archaeon]|jgi:RNase P/RNase MRP subunit p29